MQRTALRPLNGTHAKGLTVTRGNPKFTIAPVYRASVTNDV